MQFASLKYISVLGGFLAGSKISRQKFKPDVKALQLNWPRIKNQIQWDYNWDKLHNKNEYNLKNCRKKHVLVISFGSGMTDVVKLRGKKLLEEIDEELEFPAKFSKIFVGNQDFGQDIERELLPEAKGVISSLMFKPIDLSDENRRVRYISHALAEAAFRTVFHRPVLKY